MERMHNKTYPAYKDSGVAWLGEIPAHWELIRMKHLYKDVSIKNKPDAELLSVTQDQGVVPRDMVENRMVMPSGSLETFKFIQKGDFAISLRSFEGGLEYCYHDGIISPAYTVLKKKRNDLIPAYYKYLFKSHSFISELQTSVVGIRQGKNISYPELSYSFLPVPEPEEQTHIAAFLDRKTAQIDRAIAQKAQMIALLKERRQIVIHQAVTRGLNPDVAMKESGVEWIGAIPAHWEIKKLKLWCKFIDGDRGPNYPAGQDIIDEGIPFLSSKNIVDNRLDLSHLDFISEKKFEQLGRGKLQDNDIVITMRGSIGNTAIFSTDTYSTAFINAQMMILRTYGELLPQTLHLLTQCNYWKQQLGFLSYGSAQQQLSSQVLKNIKLALPPLEEQELILDFIESLSTKIKTAIACKQQEIEALKEYKATLINSAVTGKIRV